MKTPREVGHAIANTWDASCLLDEDLGWSHGPRCDTATAAIEARDAEHAHGDGYAFAVLATLRTAGWSVAVHNDYRLGGVPMTFWLFTRSGRAVKGEGGSDAEALALIRSEVSGRPGSFDKYGPVCSCDRHGNEPEPTCPSHGAPAPAVTPVPEGARMLPEDLVREHLAHARSNLEGWSEDGGFYLPTEPDAEERERVRERLRAVIFAYERVLGIDAYAAPPTPSAPPAPTQHHAYRCSKCGREETSGPLPKPPQLPVFPLPPGWALVPVADLNVDDDLHCDTCAAPSAPPREGMGPGKDGG